MTDLFKDRLHQRIAVTAQYLGWSPDTFWAATPQECTDALSDPHADPAADPIIPISRSDIHKLMENDCDG